MTEHHEYMNEVNTVINSLPVAAQNEHLDRPFTMEEKDLAVKKCNEKSAPGPDGISYRHLKSMSDNAKHILLSIFNQCLSEGTYPKALKHAWVKPIPKAGKDSTKKEGYR